MHASSPILSLRPLLLFPNNFDFLQLGPDGGRYLGAGLLSNTSLLVIKANFCALGDEGAVSLARGTVYSSSACFCKQTNKQTHTHTHTHLHTHTHTHA